MFNLSSILKKKIKSNTPGLDEAVKKGLITKEEMLRLKVERANTELKKYLDNSEGHKKRK